MNTKVPQLRYLTELFLAAAISLVYPANAEGQVLTDYRCKVERIATADAPPNSQLDFHLKHKIGKEFTVERRTGIMTGALKNSYINQPEIIDFGSVENSYKVITTLRKEQGAGYGSNVYFLIVNEYKSGGNKPFMFVENDVTYFGNCVHF